MRNLFWRGKSNYPEALFAAATQVVQVAVVRAQNHHETAVRPGDHLAERVELLDGLVVVAVSGLEGPPRRLPAGDVP